MNETIKAIVIKIAMLIPTIQRMGIIFLLYIPMARPLGKGAGRTVSIISFFHEKPTSLTWVIKDSY